MRRLLLTLPFLTFLAASTCLASPQYEPRKPPPEVPARWNRSGSALCPDDYDYVARIRRCVARAVTTGAVPAQRNRRGSAVCPEAYDYFARYKACIPR